MKTASSFLKRPGGLNPVQKMEGGGGFWEKSDKCRQGGIAPPIFWSAGAWGDASKGVTTERRFSLPGTRFRKRTGGPTQGGPRCVARAGFSLVEVLVGIGIIAALAALLLPVLSSTVESANSTKCISNLRSIGPALASYIGENSGTLPGPLLPSQGPRYNMVSGTYAAYLADFLYPYLNIPEPSPGGLPALATARRMAPMFYCPSFAKAAKDNFPNPYFVRWKIAALGTSKPPWGSYDAPPPQYPMRYLAIPEPAKTWAICDIDQKCPDLPAVSWSGSIPPQPIHRGVRNALFFDGHVAKIAEDGTPL